MNPWSLYDQLIDEIPEGIAVTDYCVNTHWTYVEAACGMGVSYTFPGGAKARWNGDPRTLDLRGLAALAKSWNYNDASLGVAALNAWHTRPEALEAAGASIDRGDDPKASNSFDRLQPAYAGKRVVVVGHFPSVPAMAGVCDLTVLERNVTTPLDTPDPACEYVIPQADFLFMTGTTITNKTAPRLLALGTSATTVVAGPSAVPARALFDAGADFIDGSTVVDAEPAKFAVKGGSKELWHAGIRMFTWENPARG